MSVVAVVLIVLVALLHVGFFALEALLWKSPRGRAVFGTSAAEAETMATLAANQGVYNLLLAGGLAWSLALSGWAGYEMRLAFLGFALLAGLFGGATVSRRIFAIQALPAALAIVAVVVAR